MHQQLREPAREFLLGSCKVVDAGRGVFAICMDGPDDPCVPEHEILIDFLVWGGLFVVASTSKSNEPKCFVASLIASRSFLISRRPRFTSWSGFLFGSTG